MIRLMIAAPASGSGKTAVTCGLLALFKSMDKKTCAFKCGPDYIDPMFHRSVLGVESHNLDLFLADEDNVRSRYKKYISGCDAAVCEGVMGYYDGVGGTTARASAWHVADVLDMPVILVMKPKGASLTLAAQIKGMCALRKPHHVAGVILNECSEMLFDSMAESLERESGIPVLGYLPQMEEARFESRHLGLYTAGEIADLTHRIDNIAVQMKKSLDMERLEALCGDESKPWTGKEAASEISGSEKGLQRAEPRKTHVAEVPCRGNAVSSAGAEAAVAIAIARDEAFCFMYHETVDALRGAGAKIIYFSPLRDSSLPDGIGGMYIPGGYPELYAERLAENSGMREAVCEAVKSGLPTIAECGGFLYLGQSLEGGDGRIYPMAGALPSAARKKERLVRFGYAELTAGEDSMLFRSGESVPVHEFHYWDSSDNGSALHAVKPVSGRQWECGFATDSLYAGFPHLYPAGNPLLAERFVKAAAERVAVKQDSLKGGSDR